MVLSLLILCAAGSVIVGRMLLKEGRLRIPFLAGAAGAGEPSVRVIYVTEFTKCGDEFRETASVTAKEVSSFLAALSPEWIVAKNTSREIELRKRLPAYCGEHLRFRFIALHKGYVCVFRGKEPSPAFLVKERPDIKEADLMAKDRARLKAGVLIEAPPDVPDDQTETWLDGRTGILLEGITEH